MSEERDEALSGRATTARPIRRVGMAGPRLGPGPGKFLTYRQSVQFFERLALSAPDRLGTETTPGGRSGSRPTR